MSAALPGALLRCLPLAVLALRRIRRLAPHPGRTTSISQFFMRGYLAAPDGGHVVHLALREKNEDRCDALFRLFSAYQATIFLTTANGLNPNQDCMDLMMLCGPEKLILERSLSRVVTPIQTEVIVRRSVVT
jgi:hypothetical protein